MGISLEILIGSYAFETEMIKSNTRTKVKEKLPNICLLYSFH